MKKIFLILNIPRTLVVYWLSKGSRYKEDIFKDLDRFAYDGKKHDKEYLTFAETILFDRCFRNVLDYRLKMDSNLKSIILRIFFPVKKDMEIGRCKIGGGLVCYHGHGVVINADEIGENLSIWQGVTIGKNPKTEKAPTIGNNVSIYTNAVVVGDIIIGDNVKIAAGTVVRQDIPDNSLAFGNPCIIKKLSVQ